MHRTKMASEVCITLEMKLENGVSKILKIPARITGSRTKTNWIDNEVEYFDIDVCTASKAIRVDVREGTLLIRKDEKDVDIDEALRTVADEYFDRDDFLAVIGVLLKVLDRVV